MTQKNHHRILKTLKLWCFLLQIFHFTNHHSPTTHRHIIFVTNWPNITICLHFLLFPIFPVIFPLWVQTDRRLDIDRTWISRLPSLSGLHQLYGWPQRCRAPAEIRPTSPLWTHSPHLKIVINNRDIGKILFSKHAHQVHCKFICDHWLQSLMKWKW